MLYEQIRDWLEESDRKAGLLEKVIPQKGLAYERDAASNDWKARYYLERYPDADVLIGCYHDQKHLDWIRQQGMYNIRLGSGRDGALTRDDLSRKHVKFIVLYAEGHDDENLYLVYRVKGEKLMRRSDMIDVQYPRPPQDSYQCYLLDEEVNVGRYDIFRVISRARTDKYYKEGAPIFHHCSDMKEYQQ